jgi:hypothetical protein
MGDSLHRDAVVRAQGGHRDAQLALGLIAIVFQVHVLCIWGLDRGKKHGFFNVNSVLILAKHLKQMHAW